MDVFRTDRIRNVVLLGHGGAGKTTLAEGMAYLSGITSRMGKVTDGNTISDFDKEEIKRKFSISTSVIPIEWGKVKINVLDTPGYFDFVGEVEEAVGAADAAIIVVSGKDGVQVGTQKAWELCEKYNLPRMFFVTEMDIDDVSYRQVVEQLTELYGKKIAPLHMPIREDGKFVGYVNIVKQAGRRYIERGQKKECPVPEYLNEYLEKYHETLMESVAEISEEFMDRYFAGEEFSVAEVSAALKMNISDGSIIPVCMGSAVNIQGVANLLDDICGYFPSPDQKTCAGMNTKTNEIYQANYDFTKAKSAYVFKTIVDPFLGKYSLVKVCSGVIKGDDVLFNVSKDSEEKLNKLYVLEGSKPIEVAELHAGDIGAIAKLGTVTTGDTLATKTTPILYGKTDISTPYTYKRYQTVNKGDDDKVSQALAKMMQEDLTLKAVNDAQNRQTLLYGIGEQHLDIVVSKLKERYKVDIVLSEPKVPFKETIRKKSDVEYKYKKQSGGHGQYGHVKMTFEPSGDLETPYVFEQTVVGGAVPKNYFPAVEKGIQESVLKGPVASYPVVGVKATLYDGSYHPVDSSEMAFKTAAIPSEVMTCPKIDMRELASE
jgi:elongation factor G